MVRFSLLLSLLIPTAWARQPANLASPVDSFVAKVGREAVLRSDVQRFAQVRAVLECAGVILSDKPLPTGERGLLDAYIDQELVFQEAKMRKTSTAGLIPQSVKSIYDREACKASWLKLGKEYASFWRTETREREGESLLVRELEKQVLVDRFRKAENISDMEIWRREAKSRYPVKILAE